MSWTHYTRALTPADGMIPHAWHLELAQAIAERVLGAGLDPDTIVPAGIIPASGGLPPRIALRRALALSCLRYRRPTISIPGAESGNIRYTAEGQLAADVTALYGIANPYTGTSAFVPQSATRHWNYLRAACDLLTDRVMLVESLQARGNRGLAGTVSSDWDNPHDTIVSADTTGSLSYAPNGEAALARALGGAALPWGIGPFGAYVYLEAAGADYSENPDRAGIGWAASVRIQDRQWTSPALGAWLASKACVFKLLCSRPTLSYDMAATDMWTARNITGYSDFDGFRHVAEEARFGLGGWEDLNLIPKVKIGAHEINVPGFAAMDGAWEIIELGTLAAEDYGSAADPLPCGLHWPDPPVPSLASADEDGLVQPLYRQVGLRYNPLIWAELAPHFTHVGALDMDP